METMKIMEFDREIDERRKQIIALGREKEGELGCGRIFSTVVILPPETCPYPWVGRYYDSGKLILLSKRLFESDSNYFADMVFLHEMAHALDYAAGERARFDCHDEFFQQCAVRLGVADEFILKYKPIEERSSLSGDLYLEEDDGNRYYIIFAIKKRPTLLERCVLHVLSTFCNIHVCWYRVDLKYRLVGWGSYESLNDAREFFPEAVEYLRRHVRSMVRQTKMLDRNSLLLGLKDGFILAFREDGNQMALDFSCSTDLLHERNRKCCYMDGFYINIPDFQTGVAEGSLLAQKLKNGAWL